MLDFSIFCATKKLLDLFLIVSLLNFIAYLRLFLISLVKSL